MPDYICTAVVRESLKPVFVKPHVPLGFTREFPSALLQNTQENYAVVHWNFLTEFFTGGETTTLSFGRPRKLACFRVRARIPSGGGGGVSIVRIDRAPIGCAVGAAACAGGPRRVPPPRERYEAGNVRAMCSVTGSAVPWHGSRRLHRRRRRRRRRASRPARVSDASTSRRTSFRSRALFVFYRIWTPHAARVTAFRRGTLVAVGLEQRGHTTDDTRQTGLQVNSAHVFRFTTPEPGSYFIFNDVQTSYKQYGRRSAFDGTVSGGFACTTACSEQRTTNCVR